MPNNDLERARAESAALLGLDLAKLTPAGTLKCDLVSALRSVVDDEIGKVDRANAADLGRLIVAVEALTKFLKESPADQRADNDDGSDPYANLKRIVEGWIEAENTERAERGLSGLLPDLATAQRRVDELEAELAELRSVLPANSPKAIPAPTPEAEKVITPDAKVITPTESEIIPPGEIGDLNMVPPRRSPPTIDGKAEPPAPSDAEREANRLRINNDRSEFYRQGLRPAGTEAWRPHTWRFE